MSAPVEFVNPVRTIVMQQSTAYSSFTVVHSNTNDKGVYVKLPAGVNQVQLTWSGIPYVNLTHRTADGNVSYTRVIDTAPVEGARRQAVITLNCAVEEDFFCQVPSSAEKDYRYKLGVQITNMSQITAI